MRYRKGFLGVLCVFLRVLCVRLHLTSIIYTTKRFVTSSRLTHPMGVYGSTIRNSAQRQSSRPLGSHSTTPHCRTRLHGARLRQTHQRPRKLRRHPACVRCPSTSPHGMVLHSHRTLWRHRGSCRSTRPTRQYPDGRTPPGRHLYRPSALRV